MEPTRGRRAHAHFADALERLGSGLLWLIRPIMHLVGVVVVFVLGVIKWLSGFLCVLTLLSLVLAGANELFGLGIWDGDYPVLRTRSEGGITTETVGDAGEFFLQYGFIALGTGLVWGVLFALSIYLDERAEEHEGW